jgi:hypothetical protein
MPLLAELPDDGGPYILPQGNAEFNDLKDRQQFFSDLHETILAQLLGGRRRCCEILDGERMIFELPPKEQLHDFVALHLVDGVLNGSKQLSVVLKIPSTGPNIRREDIYLTKEFDYYLPKVPKYLDKFSAN